ncbi:MAG: hypothetical protein AB4042_02690 [Leptolyngbyaceae cyanobacterium]
MRHKRDGYFGKPLQEELAIAMRNANHQCREKRQSSTVINQPIICHPIKAISGNITLTGTVELKKYLPHCF